MHGYGEYMTPKCSASLPAAQSNWLGGLEVPRWVSRLGSGLLPCWAWGVAPKSIDGEPGNSPATTPWPGFSFEILHHPARQTYQLKRYRQKCSGNWEASWGGSRLQRSRTLLPFVMSWMKLSEPWQGVRQLHEQHQLLSPVPSRTPRALTTDYAGVMDLVGYGVNLPLPATRVQGGPLSASVYEAYSCINAVA